MTESATTDGRGHGRRVGLPSGRARSYLWAVTGLGRGSIGGHLIGFPTRRCRRIWSHLIARPATVVEYLQRRRARAAVLLPHDAEARPHDVHHSGTAPAGRSSPRF